MCIRDSLHKIRKNKRKDRKQQTIHNTYINNRTKKTARKLKQQVAKLRTNKTEHIMSKTHTDI